MAYRLNNKCTKNYCKRTVPIQVIVQDVVKCFFFLRHSLQLESSHSVQTSAYVQDFAHLYIYHEIVQ